jgi:hypothetical protein
MLFRLFVPYGDPVRATRLSTSRPVDQLIFNLFNSDLKRSREYVEMLFQMEFVKSIDQFLI